MNKMIGSLFLLIAFYGMTAPAQQVSETSAPPVSQPTIEESLIQGNINLSKWFSGVAEGLDLFLAGEEYTKKPNETSVTLEGSGYYNRFDGFSSSLNFNVDLRLPNVEEYWQLTFTSYDESEDRGVRNRYLRQTPRERNYGAAFGLFKKLGEVRTAFRPRLSFEGTPAISHSLTVESVAEKKRGYRINPKVEFYANPSKGAGIFQALNFNFELTRMYSLTFINEGDYEGRPHIYRVTHGISLGQHFSSRASLAYNFFVIFINRPNYQLDGYNVSMAWRHILYKKILDYELIPNLDFKQEHNFVVNPGINLNINLNF